MYMKRSELIHNMQNKHPEFSLDNVESAIKKIFGFMISVILRGERIEVRNFGSFSRRLKKPRLVRNPKTGEQIYKQGQYSVYFKPGKRLKERVNIYSQDSM